MGQAEAREVLKVLDVRRVVALVLGGHDLQPKGREQVRARFQVLACEPRDPRFTLVNGGGDVYLTSTRKTLQYQRLNLAGAGRIDGAEFGHGERSGGLRSWRVWRRIAPVQIRAKRFARDSGEAFDLNDPSGGYVLPLPDRGVTDAQSASELGSCATALDVLLERTHAGNGSLSANANQALLPPICPDSRQTAEMEAQVLRTFGERMRWAREQRHYKLEQVAEYCGLDGHASVRNWEIGANFPALENLVPVAGLYGVSVDWLIWGGDVGGIDERVRKIPAIFRAGLIDRIHREIDETEAAAKKLPKEMAGEPVKDADARLRGWSAANLSKKPRSKRKAGTQ